MSRNGVVSKSADEISVVRIKGYIDLNTAEQLDKAIASLLQSKKFNLIIDLNDVEYISSSGWGVFLGNIKEVRENNGDLKLARMSPDVYEVYKVLEFFWFIKSYLTIEEAVREFDGQEHESLS